jgi:cyclopropane fatty-acyl-phospholipid synthase-like methyltransferase
MAGALSRVKYRVSARLRPKTYWNLMGRFRAVPAVTSAYRDLEECLASGREVVDLLDGLGVVHPDAVTLHIGSGLGRVEHHLRHRVQRCVGVDISPSMVKQARQNVAAENVEFAETSGAGLEGFLPASFDLIYSFLVFQHLPRARFRSYVVDAYAHLRSGGHLVFQLMIDETGGQPEPPEAHPYGLRHYRRADVEAFLDETGFTGVVRVTLDGGADDPASTPTGDVVFCATKPPSP